MLQEEEESKGQPVQPLPSMSSTTSSSALSSSSSSRPLPFLAQYGHQVRLLPYTGWLLKPPYDPVLLRGFTDQDDVPTEHDVLSHLMERCPAAKIPYFILTYDDLDFDDSEEAIMGLSLPRVRHLDTEACYADLYQDFSTLKRVLDRCSNILERLDLEVCIGDSRGRGEKLDSKKDWIERTCNEWTSLRTLNLRKCIDMYLVKSLWPWLWKRCGQVEKLKVEAISSIITFSLAEGMLAHMPNLKEICLGRRYFADEWTDNEVVALLSGSRQGWKTVRLTGPLEFNKVVMEALAKHYSTLEKFSVQGCDGFTADCMVQVLSSCPRLHSIFDSGTDIYYTPEHFYPEEFIDQDDNTELPRPWACETSLKEFKIHYTAFPISTLWNPCAEGPKLRSQFYDRLARFTNLEVLWLEWMDSVFGLESSLQDGLSKLGGLKALKEVRVSRHVAWIGVREVQWMTEHWPRLRVIIGLDKDGDGREAVKWLEEHSPGITVLKGNQYTT